MRADGISRLGTWGLSVPANTTSPSSNFARANSLASASVANVRVTRMDRRLGKMPRLRNSNVTYQACSISGPGMRRPERSLEAAALVRKRVWRKAPSQRHSRQSNLGLQLSLGAIELQDSG